MDRSDLGFAFFLALLLLAPSLPVPGFAAGSNVSVAAAGLVVWFMLAPRLPVRAVLTMPMVLALIGFSLYGLLGSLASGRLVSIAYGLQYAFYALLGGIFVPAYLLHKQRQGRELNVWRVLALDRRGLRRGHHRLPLDRAHLDFPGCGWQTIRVAPDRPGPRVC